MAGISTGVTLIEREPYWASPDDIDLDDFTEYQTYVELNVTEMTTPDSLVLENEVFPGGYGQAFPLREISETITIKGFFTTLEERNGFKKFRGLHSNAISHNQLYLIIKNLDGYEKFLDPDETQQDYVPGWVSEANIPWNQDSPREWKFSINFVVIWSL